MTTNSSSSWSGSRITSNGDRSCRVSTTHLPGSMSGRRLAGSWSIARRSTSVKSLSRILLMTCGVSSSSQSHQSGRPVLGRGNDRTPAGFEVRYHILRGNSPPRVRSPPSTCRSPADEAQRRPSGASVLFSRNLSRLNVQHSGSRSPWARHPVSRNRLSQSHWVMPLVISSEMGSEPYDLCVLVGLRCHQLGSLQLLLSLNAGLTRSFPQIFLPARCGLTLKYWFRSAKCLSMAVLHAPTDS